MGKGITPLRRSEAHSERRRTGVSGGIDARFSNMPPQVSRSTQWDMLEYAIGNSELEFRNANNWISGIQ